MTSDYEYDRIRQDVLRMSDAEYEVYARLVQDGSIMTHDELAKVARKLA